MSVSAPVPVILCGKDQLTGELVTNHLKPEFQVIYFTADLENAKTDVPLLLGGKTPEYARSWNIGTGNYSQSPQAVILGSAYYAELRDSLREVVTNGEHKAVPWIVSGLNQAQSAQAKAERMRTGTTQEYASSVTRKIKDVLSQVLENGDGQAGGLHYYLHAEKR